MKAIIGMSQRPHNIIKFFVLGIAVLAITYGLFHFYSAAEHSDSRGILPNSASITAEPSSLFASAAQKAQTDKKLGAESSKSTYRPQVTRPIKQYARVTGSDGSVDRSMPGWWLYANSQAEAAWLDYFGYPTPSEELSLAKMSDQELSALVSVGDLNAKSHQVARLASEVFQQESVEKSRIAEGMQSRLLAEGGPYQAFTIYRAYGDLLQAYLDLPAHEQTPKRKAILERYGQSAQLAYEIGSAYDDHTMMALQNGNIWELRQQVSIAKEEGKSSIALARTLASIAARRREMNIAPIVLMARPETPRYGTFVPLERY
jgi:hypothetical protein